MLCVCQYMLKPLWCVVTRKKKEERECVGGGGEGGRGGRGGEEDEEEVREVGVFLPNRDLISESEHTVCKDATRHGAAPFLPVGRLAL